MWLIPAAIIILVRDDRSFMWLIAALIASAIVATVWGFLDIDQHMMGAFHGVSSKIGRNADMLAVTTLMCIVLVDDRMFREHHPRATMAITVAIPLLLTGLFLSGIRGAWLIVAMGIVAFALFFSRRWLIAISASALLIAVGIFGSSLEAELVSFTDLNNNRSNITRLQLWVAGLEFARTHLWLGVGAGSLPDLFLNFFNAQPPEFQNANKLALNHPTEFHNSYLQILIEWGAIHLFLFIGCLAAALLLVAHRLRSMRPYDAVFARAFLVTSIGFLPAQFFHSDLHSYGAVPYLLLAGGAMRAAARASQKEQEA